jgi:hypothetical protein
MITGALVGLDGSKIQRAIPDASRAQKGRLLAWTRSCCFSRLRCSVPHTAFRLCLTPTHHCHAARDPIVDVSAPICPNPGHRVAHRVKTVKKDFDLLGFYNVKVTDLETIKGEGAYAKELSGRHTHGVPEEVKPCTFSSGRRASNRHCCGDPPHT